MSRTLHALRASITVGAFLIVGATAHAADAAVQRVAMACPHGIDAAGCNPAPMSAHSVATAHRAQPAVTKAPVRREHVAHSDVRDNDGSRFMYDSCGCSN